LADRRSLIAERQQEIRRFDIAMHQAMQMSVFQADGGLANDLAGIADGQFAVATEQHIQVQPFGILQHEEMNAFFLTAVKGLDDVRMLQLADGLHLAFEARHHFGIAQMLARQQLNRHSLVEMRVPRQVDGPHATLAKARP
jgi:hypothetical protein